MSAMPAETSQTVVGPRVKTRRVWRGRVRGASLLLGLTPLVLLLGAWEVFGEAASFTFPTPSTWWSATVRMMDEGVLLPALQRTLLTFILGAAIAVVTGTLLGWAIGASRTVERLLGPMLDFFRALPSPALVPVATVLFGVTIGMSTIVMVVAIVWPVLLSTISARHTVPTVRLDMGRVLGLSRLEQMRKVVLPSLLPAVMTGTRVAVSQGLIVALLIDIIGSGEGIGRLLVVRQQSFDAASVWALLVIIGIFGLVVNGVVAILDERVQRGWR